MSLYPLIQLLSDGAYHTGTELGEKLGVSRAAIWKKIRQLPEVGLQVTSSKTLGYALLNKLDLLDSSYLTEFLAENNSSLKGECLALVGSTNSELSRRLAKNSALSKTFLLAEMQTQGKGRRGKYWYSPFASSLSVSLAWRFDEPASSLQGLSLAVGVTVKQVLNDLGVENIQLKWPNDIYLDNAKLAGILLEVSGDLSGPCSLVLGVGINIDEFVPNKEIDQPLAFLSSSKIIKRNELAGRLLLALEKLLQIYPKTGFVPWQDLWNKAHIWKNQHVNLITPSEVTRVKLGNVNSLGELEVIMLDGSCKYINAGELSLRKAE